VTIALPGRTAATAASSAFGKSAYAALFVVVVPAILVAWARGAAEVVSLPPLRSVPMGAALVIAGLALVAAGAWALRVHGGGLPMNAYPPPRFVERGVYALVPHPMYVGFCGIVLGISLASGSASGVYLVAPMTALGCVALVLGYERHDLARRFGRSAPRTAIRLPDDDAAAPSLMDRLSVHVLVLWPWLAIYAAIAHLGAPPDAITTSLPGEARWPVVEGSELVYVSTYAAVVLATVVARSRATLRRFAVRGLHAMVLVFPLYLAFPFVAPPRPFTPTSLLGELVVLERSVDTAACALPSFHVVWAVFAAAVLAATWPRARLLFHAWALAVAVSCVTTGAHTVLDVLAGFVAALAVVRASAIWGALRRGTERIANSWREWRIGPLRVINHGAYAAVGTALAAGIAGTLAGPGSATATIMASLVALVLAGLWAQLIEGSPQLLRPYGFYGGVLGIIAGCMVAPLFGKSTWLMLAAFSTAGPWVQSIGRLRCLVQGCCHGSLAPDAIGIRYTHPRSRVCRLAHLAGMPVHPTPLYSILWNVVVALVMGRLWSLHASLQLIGGLYLVLTGLGRFVEEAYRGEPQTKIIAGLRLYQWIGIASVLIGILVTALGGDGRAPDPVLTWPPIVAAVIAGLASGAALGVDFPSSKRRFSRLA
jgi:protein-S-isoprenylcysteine O-methyltransferase Ste14/membrane-associated phospholipid phosphatase